MSARGPPRLVSTEYTNCVRTHIGHAEPQEVEDHQLQRALQGNLQLGLAPSSEQTTFARGGGGGCSSFPADFFPVIADGKLPQRPYTGTRRRANTHRAPQPAPPADPSKCAQHSATACTNCKRLRRTAEACCALGHHADDHIARRPQLQLCPLHGLPPCLRCTLNKGECATAVSGDTINCAPQCLCAGSAHLLHSRNCPTKDHARKGLHVSLRVC